MRLDGIGQVDLVLDIDQDDYSEWLSDMELSDSRESLVRYIEDNAEIEVEYFDNETYHHCGYDTCSLSELEDCVGEKMFGELLNELLENGSASFETSYIHNSAEFDVNNPDELNQVAMKILNHGEYHKGCRGFILTNGVVVYTPIEHNEVSQIKGIDGTYDFLRRGNIRILDRSIDIALPPTREQRDVLRQVIASYSDGELYLDVFTDKSSFGAQYYNADWRFVMGEIDRWFSEGIKPQGRMFENRQNSMKNNKNITLTKEQFERLVQESVADVMQLNEAFKSNTLMDFMNAHGGVKKIDDFGGHIRQSGLGDISDDMILYTQEFPSLNDAWEEKRKLTQSDYRGIRSDWDMKALFFVYQANDGTCLLVGVDRNKIKTGVYWSGETLKKNSDRRWRDDKDPESFKAGRYVDDKDKYYYGAGREYSPGRDFGLQTNKHLKYYQHDEKQRRDLSAQQGLDYSQIKKGRIDHLHDYLNKYYPKIGNKMSGNKKQ